MRITVPTLWLKLHQVATYQLGLSYDVDVKLGNGTSSDSRQMWMKRREDYPNAVLKCLLRGTINKLRVNQKADVR